MEINIPCYRIPGEDEITAGLKKLMFAAITEKASAEYQVERFGEGNPNSTEYFHAQSALVYLGIAAKIGDIVQGAGAEIEQILEEQRQMNLRAMGIVPEVRSDDWLAGKFE